MPISSQGSSFKPLYVVRDNLPVKLDKDTSVPGDGGVAERNSVDFLRLTASDVVKLRESLIVSIGQDHQWTDDEIRSMALNTLNAMQVFLRIAEAQCQRGILSLDDPDKPVWKNEDKGGRNP